MMVHYNREEALKSRLNTFLRERLALPNVDYYSRLNQEAFIELKSVLSDINNIFTLRVTLAFVEWLSDRLKLDEDERKHVRSEVLNTKPNANGYDLEIADPVHIVAEVKCNVPINQGTVYGSAQRDGIAKDVASLVEGKSKSSVDPEKCLKFMVLLDKPEIRQATDHFVKNMKVHRDRMVFVQPGTSLDAEDKVYVVFVEL